MPKRSTAARLDTSRHDRRLARRRAQDPEFEAEFLRQQRAIAAIDAIVNQLDVLRVEHELTKADLARAIDKNPAAVRRLLTAKGNPELATVVAMADALDADIAVVPRKRRRRTVTLARLRHLTRWAASACPDGGLASLAA